MQGVCLTLVLIIFFWTSSAESLKCYTCSNVGNVSDCLTITRCSGDQKCYTEVVGEGNSLIYNLGCRPLAQCQLTTTQPPIISIVGRHIDTRTFTTGCSQCCAVDACNDKLCTEASKVISSTENCKDDSDYNCEFISGTFNLCGDIHHAKLVCRKWCGLCDLVDGGWSVWSTWSSCDSNCGQGHTSRHRSCTEPAPSHGGLDCSGISVQVSNCSVASCPVHGGWSIWSSWGQCSVTCSVGLQRRDRSCSKPVPGPDGNPCFGDASNYRVCFLKACANGGWSGWSSWGSCSASCNGGQKSRSRMCNNPAPSSFGKSCDGTNEQNVICNTNSCPAPVVAFSVTNPSSQLAGGNTSTGIPIFNTILTNVGNDYNTASGVFKCAVPGIYQFSFSFMSASLNSHCYIYQNGIARVYTQNSDSSSSYWKSASISIYLNMLNNDTVSLLCVGWQHVSHSTSAVFNGALIAATK